MKAIQRKQGHDLIRWGSESSRLSFAIPCPRLLDARDPPGRGSTPRHLNRKTTTGPLGLNGLNLVTKVKERGGALRVGCDDVSRVQLPARRTEPLHRGVSLPQEEAPQQRSITPLRRGKDGADVQRNEDVFGLTQPLSVDYELDRAV